MKYFHALEERPRSGHRAFFGGFAPESWVFWRSSRGPVALVSGSRKTTNSAAGAGAGRLRGLRSLAPYHRAVAACGASGSPRGRRLAEWLLRFAVGAARWCLAR